MGTIQPSRFLSRSGKILAGVRRVALIPKPAAGADWTVTVPAGVMWRVLLGQMTLTTSATVDARDPVLHVSIDGESEFVFPVSGTVAASTTAVIPIFTTGGLAALYSVANVQCGMLPDDFLPQGAIISTVTALLQAADQWSNVSLWIEEVYFTDAQLSEISRTRAELERDIAQYEYEQAQAAGGNI